jgi:hypothetical protein
MRYEYATKPSKCPVCNSEKIADILYGYPDFSEELDNHIKSGDIVLGGCVVDGDEPAWKCIVCNTEFFQN